MLLYAKSQDITPYYGGYTIISKLLLLTPARISQSFFTAIIEEGVLF